MYQLSGMHLALFELDITVTYYETIIMKLKLNLKVK